jgi:hypothetical protein
MLTSELPSEKGVREYGPQWESPAEKFESNTCDFKINRPRSQVGDFEGSHLGHWL